MAFYVHNTADQLMEGFINAQLIRGKVMQSLGLALGNCERNEIKYKGLMNRFEAEERPFVTNN